MTHTAHSLGLPPLPASSPGPTAPHFPLALRPLKSACCAFSQALATFLCLSPSRVLHPLSLRCAVNRLLMVVHRWAAACTAHHSPHRALVPMKNHWLCLYRSSMPTRCPLMMTKTIILSCQRAAPPNTRMPLKTARIVRKQGQN